MSHDFFCVSCDAGHRKSRRTKHHTVHPLAFEDPIPIHPFPFEDPLPMEDSVAALHVDVPLPIEDSKPV